MERDFTDGFELDGGGRVRQLVAGAGEVRQWGGTVVTIKTTASETGGRYSLLEIV